MAAVELPWVPGGAERAVRASEAAVRCSRIVWKRTAASRPAARATAAIAAVSHKASGGLTSTMSR